MIAQKTVQEVYDTAKIEDVVQDFVPLKRAGSNLKGNCPFHNEKTPSFVVSPAKNIYKCFGCGKAGNPITFVREHERFSFPEAVRYLAQKYNIEIIEKEMTPEERAAQQLNDSLFVVNELAKEFFQNQLLETDRGKSVGLSYFKGRGYREETIEKFSLGYAPNGRNDFVEYAIAKGFKKEMLEKLGLMSKRGFDFFRDRVMFTINNLSGKPIAFAGRILQKDAKAPKYINSPETDIYNKSKTLFGMYQAKGAISKLDECMLVEGYTDVISLHQSGFENVVASSGTSLTRQQLQLIKRFTPNLKILYDGDKAGVKAALRGLDLALETDLNVKIALIPEGNDPDSHLQKVGATAFKEFLETGAKDFIIFKADLLLAEAKDDPIKKAGVVKDIVSSIGHIPDQIKRQVYIKECARMFEMEESSLMGELGKTIADLKKQAQTRRNASLRNQSAKIADDTGFPTNEFGDQGGVVPERKVDEPKTSGDEMQEKDVVRVLIAGGSQMYGEEEKISVAQYVIKNIEDVIDHFENAHYQLIVNEVVRLLKAKKEVTSKHFINHSDPKISKIAVDLVSNQYEMSKGWAEKDIHLQTQKIPELNFSNDGEQALKRFRLKKIIKMCGENQERLKALNDSGDESKLLTLLKVQQKLITMRDALANELNIVVL